MIAGVAVLGLVLCVSLAFWLLSVAASTHYGEWALRRLPAARPEDFKTVPLRDPKPVSAWTRASAA